MAELIRVQTSDDQFFDVPAHIAERSNLIKTLLENLGMADANDDLIPLTKVAAKEFEKFVEWADYHQVKYLLFLK